MQKIFGSPISGLYTHLPTIVAELTEEMRFNEHGGAVTHQRGSRVYLVLSNPEPLSSDTVDGIVRTQKNNLRARDIPWSSLRFFEIARVPSIIGERCWRGTKEEMEKMVERLKSEKQVLVNNFDPNVYID